MKKIINPYNALLISTLFISALVIAMISEGENSLLLKWLPLTLLWGITLGYLKNPVTFYSIIKDKVFVSYLIFIAWAILSSLTLSVAKAASILILMPFISGILSYFIAFNSNEKKDYYFDRLLIVFGLFLAFYTGYQKFFLEIPRPYGLLNNWNTHAAVLAIIILPWILRYAVKQTPTSFQLITISSFSFIFAYAMGLTLSRGALIVILTAFFGILFLIGRQKCFYKHSLVLLTALLSGYVLSSLSFEDSIIHRISEITEAKSVVSLGSGRHLLWLPAWEMFLDRPFLGWGLGNFRFLYSQYKPPLSQEAGQFVHNDYLQFLVELGPVGLLLFLVFVFFIIKQLISLLFITHTKISNHKTEAYLYLLIVTGLLIHSFFTFHLFHLSIQIILGYYLGRSSRYSLVDTPQPSLKTKATELGQKYASFYYSFSSLIILLTSCFGLSLFFLHQADNETSAPAKLDYYWKASLFFPALEHYDSYSALLLSEQLKTNKARDTFTQQLNQQMAATALADINSAINKTPFNTRNYITKANILKSTGQPIATIYQQYEKAIKNEPTALSIRYDYSRLLFKHDQADKALKILWGAWNRLNLTYYKTGLEYLRYQLDVNSSYGNKQKNTLIEQEIQRIRKLKSIKEGGYFVFTKQ